MMTLLLLFFLSQWWPGDRVYMRRDLGNGCEPRTLLHEAIQSQCCRDSGSCLKGNVGLVDFGFEWLFYFVYDAE